MKTLEDLLRVKVQSEDKDGNPIEVSPDFSVAVQRADPSGDGVHIVIHPHGHNGDTLDLLVNGDHISHI